MKGAADALRRAAAAAGLVAIPGALAALAGKPWLFPSLGPTAFLIATAPREAASRFYNAAAGHACGAAAAFLSVLLLGAGAEPSALAAHALQPRRAAASALAVAGTILLQRPLRALHAPAAATTLLITLGGFAPTAADAASIALGVLLVAGAGEALRRARVL